MFRIREFLDPCTDNEKSAYNVSCILSVAPTKCWDGIADRALLLVRLIQYSTMQTCNAVRGSDYP